MKKYKEKTRRECRTHEVSRMTEAGGILTVKVSCGPGKSRNSTQVL